MKILVINAGSSSLKYRLFNMTDGSTPATGLLERIGEKEGTLTYIFTHQGSEKKIVRKQEIKDHKHGMLLAIEFLLDEKTGVIDNTNEIDAIGHRVVQGGEIFSSATRVNAKVKNAIVKNISLAPIHNPANLTGIEMAEQLFPNIPNVAVFDTEFHQTMPAKAFLYALPYEYYSNLKVRRYGFHGTSHKYVAKQAARHMGLSMDELSLITIHLGNGCSICAIEKGECKDTSMGMTPLGGLMMGTRVGDVDPAVIGYLRQQTGIDIDQLETSLNKHSGLKGICGLSDMRDIHDACTRKDEKARLAIEMFCYQIKKYVGAYMAVLNTVDALIFTAGIGENDAVVREKVCENLECFGIHIDMKKNRNSKTKAFAFHALESRLQLWVIPTNEELQIAIETQKNIKNCDYE